MTIWRLTLWCAFVLLKFPNGKAENRTPLLPGRVGKIPEFLGLTGTPVPVKSSESPEHERSRKAKSFNSDLTTTDADLTEAMSTTVEQAPDPPDPRYPVQHAGLPRGLAVTPLPLQDSYHELMLNVSWQHSIDPPAKDYSIEVSSVTNTMDCQTPICYEYNIPGEASWWLVPSVHNSIVETCAVHPGCSYHVRLIAHPWDGHTAANLHVQLDECVAGVCSCAYSPRLPVPAVMAQTVSIQGEIFVNVSWTTPEPAHPQRLPPGLRKQRYLVSIGKQMVSDAHPSPWFANTVTRFVDTDGAILERDPLRSLLLPIVERSGERTSERSGERGFKPRNFILDVRLLAKVSLIDDRGCVGPEGNATAYDPAEASKRPIGTYILWAVFGGACVVAICVLVALSTRLVKRVLNAFRPAPVSAPLEPLRGRPAWFPLQIRTSCPSVTVNECRKHLFTKKDRQIENLPPTEAALKQHTIRAVLQAIYI